MISKNFILVVSKNKKMATTKKQSKMVNVKKTKGIIAILTGGGDVPGLNPAIRAVTIRANREGYKVIGLRRGWAGITELVRDNKFDNSNNFIPLTDDIVNKAGRTGGTFLHTSRTRPSHMTKDAVPQHLKEKYGTDLVLVLEPGKASVYPDDIPARYKHKPGTTNYEYIRGRAKDLGINLIDFNAWFMAMKDTASWPLFPKQGTHWSEYAMWYAADSLLHYIRDIRDITLGAVVRDSMVISSRLQSTDYDAGQTLNLLCSLPHSPMPYPVYHFNTEGITHKPNVLAIADSYYWNIFNTRIPEKLFNNQAFWYFYKKVYPDSYHGDKLVKDLDLRAEVEKQDVIFFMSTERFLYKFDRGFVDDLWEIYGLRSSSDRLTQYKTGILNLDPWFSEVISEAGREGESLGKMLELEARHLLWKNEPERFYALYGPAPVANDIRKNPAWFADVRRRAANNNISVEERLIEEATYMLRNKYPGALEEYEDVRKIMSNIRNDSIWFAHVMEKAKRYFMTEEEVIRADAEYVFRLENK